MTKGNTVLSWTMAVISAVIMLQTLFFKFTGAAESVYIFSQLGIEPFGRIGVGIAELVASILLIVPKTRFLGALMGIGLMLGAILAHVTQLGIVIMNDGGYLFALCLIVLMCSLICLYLERTHLSSFFKIGFNSK